MKAQDKTERVLRSLHLVMSRSETYAREPSKVIVDREQVVRLLNELTECIYDMMNEYEMTTESRNMAEREFQKQGDQIVLKANHRAEDVYAASVMYTDEALNSVQDIMEDTAQTIEVLFEEMQHKLKDEKQRLRSNQLELRSQLQDLADTDKYLKIIEERNKEIEKEKKAQKNGAYAAEEKNIYADRSTGIKINREYFEMMGIPLEEDLQDEPISDESLSEKEQALADEIADLGLVLDTPGAMQPDPELARRAAEAQVRIDADAEYFRWKEQQEAEKNSGQQLEAAVDPAEEPLTAYQEKALESSKEETGSEQIYEALYEPEPDYAAQEYGYETEPVYDEEPVYDDGVQGHEEPLYGTEPAYENDMEAAAGAGYDGTEVGTEAYGAEQMTDSYDQSKPQDVPSYEEKASPSLEEVAAAGKAQQELIDKAAREAEEELSAGIHAIWQSMSEAMKKDEEERILLNEDQGDDK